MVLYQSRETQNGKSIDTEHIGFWDGEKAVLSGGLTVRKKEWLIGVAPFILEI